MSRAHEPLCTKRLCSTVSKRPPAIDMPVPTGPALADPRPGTLGLLLSWTLLSMNTQQEREWVIVLVPLPGQRPSCGEGRSSLFWLLVSNPSLLRSKIECLTIRRPPEFVPE